jgi:hypothetical protein
MSAKRIQLRGSDCGSAFIAATARRIAARSGSLADRAPPDARALRERSAAAEHRK